MKNVFLREFSVAEGIADTQTADHAAESGRAGSNEKKLLESFYLFNFIKNQRTIDHHQHGGAINRITHMAFITAW